MWKWLGLLACVAGLPGCERPETADTPREGEESWNPGESGDRGAEYHAIREEVIGKRFATLTLGEQRFEEVEVRDITDHEIVFAHAGGIDRVSWSEVSEEVRDRWGYNPFPEPRTDGERVVKRAEDWAKDAADDSETSPDAVAEATKNARAETDKTLEPREGEADPAERVRELARRRSMLEAQLAGIQSIESDLARHSVTLEQLRGRLQSIRAKQGGRPSGGTVVERVNGQSTLVDRKKEAQEVLRDIEVEEQLVARLSKTLREARKKYQEMQRAFEEFRRE